MLPLPSTVVGTSWWLSIISIAAVEKRSDDIDDDSTIQPRSTMQRVELQSERLASAM